MYNQELFYLTFDDFYYIIDVVSAFLSEALFDNTETFEINASRCSILSKFVI